MELRKRILGMVLIVAMLVTYMPNLAFAAEDTSTIKVNQSLVLKSTAKGKRQINLSWNKIEGATRYEVMGAEYGGEVETINDNVTANKLQVKSIYGKRLKAHTRYYFCVSAFNGDKAIETAKMFRSYYACSMTGNTYGKYGNVKTLKFKGTTKKVKNFRAFAGDKINLAKKAKVVQTVYGKKKLIPTGKIKKLRYKSNNPDVAKVSTKGKVTVLSDGIAYISIMSVNGMRVLAKINSKAVKLVFHKNSNSATGSMDPLVLPYKAKEAIYIPESGFTREGYHLDGWSLQEGSSKIKYSATQKFDIDDIKNLYADDSVSTIDLYAVWAANESTTQGGGDNGGSSNPGTGRGEITLQQKIQIIYEAYPSMANDMLDSLYQSISYNSSMTDAGKQEILEKITEYKDQISSDAKGLTPQKTQEMVEEAMVEAYTQIIALVASGNATLATPLYVVTFKANGPNGQGLDTLRVVKDGEKVTNIPELALTGYDFLGWYEKATGDTKFNEETKIVKDTTVYAHWKAKSGINYVVQYLGEPLSADGKTYDVLATSPVNSATADSTVKIGTDVVKKSFPGFKYKENQQTDYTVSADGSTIVKVYYDRESYSVVINDTPANSGSSARYGDTVNLPQIPNNTADQVFDGWLITYKYAGETFVLHDLSVAASKEVTSFIMPAGPVTITAKWKAKEEVEEETIGEEESPEKAVDLIDELFNGLSGDALNGMDNGTKQNILTIIQEYKNYISSEASRTDITEEEIRQKIENKITELYQQITNSVENGNNASGATKYYVVKFSANGHGFDSITIVKENTKVANPGDLSADSYEFKGWYTAANTGTTFEFSTTNITENTTIYAHWKAKQTAANYVINYLGETLSGDSYELLAISPVNTASANSTVKIGTEVLVKSFPGFKIKNDQISKEFKINRDGSTEVNVYYERESYKVTVDKEGLFRANGIQIEKYGSIVDIPDRLDDKEDYLFDGWLVTYKYAGKSFVLLNLGAADLDMVTSFIMPAGDVTISAKWAEKPEERAEKVNVKVEHYLEKAFSETEDKYYLDDTDTFKAYPNTSIKYADALKDYAKTYEGYYEAQIRETATSMTVSANADENVIKLYYKIKRSTITYDYSQASEDAPPAGTATAEAYGVMVQLPTELPTSENAIFTGWNITYQKTNWLGIKTTEPVNFNKLAGEFEMPAGDVTVTPQFEAVPSGSDVFTLTFYMRGLANDYVCQAISGESLQKYLPKTYEIVQNNGYQINGWSATSAEAAAGNTISFTGQEKVAANADYYLSWSAKKVKYTVQYFREALDGSAPELYTEYTFTASAGAELTKEELSASAKFEFEGFEFDCFSEPTDDENYAIEGDGSTEIQAYYNRTKHKVTFAEYADGVTGTHPQPQTGIKYGQSVNITADASKGDKAPDTWLVTYTGKDDKTYQVAVDNTSSFVMPAYDVTVSPVFITDMVTVTFDMNGYGEEEKVKIEKGTKVNPITPEPISGVKFCGWSENPNAEVGSTTFDFTQDIDRKITLYAIWESSKQLLNVHLYYQDKDPDGSLAFSDFSSFGTYNCTYPEGFETSSEYILELMESWAIDLPAGSEFYGLVNESNGQIYLLDEAHIADTKAFIQSTNETAWAAVEVPTFTALYKCSSYELLYYADEASAESIHQDKVRSWESVTLSVPEGKLPDKAGYNFKGWKVYLYDNAGNKYRDYGTTTAAFSVPGVRAPAGLVIQYRAYAQWEKIPPASNTVKFYLDNQGTLFDSVSVASGETTPTPKSSDVTAPENCTLLGWGLSSDSTEYIEPGAETPAITENVSYYAIWQNNEEEDVDPTGKVQVGIEHYLEKIVAEDGYRLDTKDIVKLSVGTNITSSTFDSKYKSQWAKNYEGFGEPEIMKDAEGKSDTYRVKSDGTTTVRLAYPRKSYHYTYDLNGGTCAAIKDLSGDAKFESVVRIATAEPKLTGKEFAGWKAYYKANAGTVAEVLDETLVLGNRVFMPAADVVITAQWKEESAPVSGQCSITFDMNKITADELIAPKLVDKGATADAVSAEATGYTFLGWYKNDPRCLPGNLWNWDTPVVTDITLYAKWRPHKYKVKYNPNSISAEGTMSADSFEYGTAGKLSKCTYNVDDYYFAGWTDVSGQATSVDDVKYVDGAQVLNLSATDDAVVNLYACWLPGNKVAINYTCDPLQGSVNPTMEFVEPTTGSADGSVATPLDGYKFDHWENSAGTTVCTAEAFKPEMSGGAYVSETYTAIFCEELIGEEYEIILDANENHCEGTVSSEAADNQIVLTMQYGTPDVLPLNAFIASDTSEIVAGWNTKANGGGVNFRNGTSSDAMNDYGMSIEDYAAQNNNQVTLYAQWHNATGGRIIMSDPYGEYYDLIVSIIERYLDDETIDKILDIIAENESNSEKIINTIQMILEYIGGGNDLIAQAANILGGVQGVAEFIEELLEFLTSELVYGEAQYTFYDADLNEIKISKESDELAQLATAKYYDINGKTGLLPKYAISATVDGDPASPILTPDENVTWGPDNMPVDVSNYDIMSILSPLGFGYSTYNAIAASERNAEMFDGNTIWSWTKELRANNINGCGDWAVPSWLEYITLSSMNPESMAEVEAGGKSIWSSGYLAFEEIINLITKIEGNASHEDIEEMMDEVLPAVYFNLGLPEDILYTSAFTHDGKLNRDMFFETLDGVYELLMDWLEDMDDDFTKYLEPGMPLVRPYLGYISDRGSAHSTMAIRYIRNHSYTLTYKPGSYSVEDKNTAITADFINGTSTEIIDNPYTPKDKLRVFVGWNTREDCKGMTYLPGQTIALTNRDITLYPEYLYPVGGRIYNIAKDADDSDELAYYTFYDKYGRRINSDFTTEEKMEEFYQNPENLKEAMYYNISTPRQINSKDSNKVHAQNPTSAVSTKASIREYINDYENMTPLFMKACYKALDYIENAETDGECEAIKNYIDWLYTQINRPNSYSDDYFNDKVTYIEYLIEAYQRRGFSSEFINYSQSMGQAADKSAPKVLDSLIKTIEDCPQKTESNSYSSCINKIIKLYSDLEEANFEYFSNYRKIKLDSLRQEMEELDDSQTVQKLHTIVANSTAQIVNIRQLEFFISTMEGYVDDIKNETKYSDEVLMYISNGFGQENPHYRFNLLFNWYQEKITDNYNESGSIVPFDLSAWNYLEEQFSEYKPVAESDYYNFANFLSEKNSKYDNCYYGFQEVYSEINNLKEETFTDFANIFVHIGEASYSPEYYEWQYVISDEITNAKQAAKMTSSSDTDAPIQLHDKIFDVIATVDGDPENPILSSEPLEWGAYNAKIFSAANADENTEEDLLGGFDSTQRALSSAWDFASKTGTAREGNGGTIWTWIDEQRQQGTNGCRDWYIPSMEELNNLGESLYKTADKSDNDNYDCNISVDELEDLGDVWSGVSYDHFGKIKNQAAKKAYTVELYGMALQDSSSLVLNSKTHKERTIATRHLGFIDELVVEYAEAEANGESKYQIISKNCSKNGEYASKADFTTSGSTDIVTEWKSDQGFVIPANVSFSTKLYKNLAAHLLDKGESGTVATYIKVNPKKNTANPLGGRIYYIDETASQTDEYSFFDENGNVIMPQYYETDENGTITGYTDAPKRTVENLSQAMYSYRAKGSNDCSQKYYIYATRDGNPSSDAMILNDKYSWMNSNIELIGAFDNEIGTGKNNSLTLLSDKKFNTANSVWEKLEELRATELNGCNDWFIPSEQEFVQASSSASKFNVEPEGTFLTSTVLGYKASVISSDSWNISKAELTGDASYVVPFRSLGESDVLRVHFDAADEDASGTMPVQEFDKRAADSPQYLNKNQFTAPGDKVLLGWRLHDANNEKQKIAPYYEYTKNELDYLLHSEVVLDYIDSLDQKEMTKNAKAYLKELKELRKEANYKPSVLDEEENKQLISKARTCIDGLYSAFAGFIQSYQTPHKDLVLLYIDCEKELEKLNNVCAEVHALNCDDEAWAQNVEDMIDEIEYLRDDKLDEGIYVTYMSEDEMKADIKKYRGYIEQAERYIDVANEEINGKAYGIDFLPEQEVSPSDIFDILENSGVTSDVSDVTLYAVWGNADLIGGRIYYYNDEGASHPSTVYWFFDESGNMIRPDLALEKDDPSIADLEDAYRYKVVDSDDYMKPANVTNPNYYVYPTEDGRPDSKAILATADAYYCYAKNSSDAYQVYLGATHAGKYNTALNYEEEAIKQGSVSSGGSTFETIWHKLLEIRGSDQYHNITDWFVPNIEEAEELVSFSSGDAQSYLDRMGTDRGLLLSEEYDSFFTDGQGNYLANILVSADGQIKTNSVSKSNTSNVTGFPVIRVLGNYQDILIHYDANGGSGDAMLDQYKSKSPDKLKLRKCTYTAPVEGMTLMCWNTKADGTGISVSKDWSAPVSEFVEKVGAAEVTLYAQWAYPTGGRLIVAKPNTGYIDFDESPFLFYDSDGADMSDDVYGSGSEGNVQYYNIKPNADTAGFDDVYHIIATVSGDSKDDKLYTFERAKAIKDISANGIEWGAYGKSTGSIANGVTAGYFNTNHVLNEVSENGALEAESPDNVTVWSWLQTVNNQKLHGYSDWYIPSQDEIYRFFVYTSGMIHTSEQASKFMSSTERSSRSVATWKEEIEKNATDNAVVARTLKNPNASEQYKLTIIDPVADKVSVVRSIYNDNKIDCETLLDAFKPLESEYYVFRYLNEKADGTGTTYKITDAIKLTEDLVLYAIYRPVNLETIGGKIFKVEPYDKSTLSKRYAFFDANKREIIGWSSGTSEQMVENLANAKYYVQKKASNKEEFYVYATTDGEPDGTKESITAATSSEAREIINKDYNDEAFNNYNDWYASADAGNTYIPVRAFASEKTLKVLFVPSGDSTKLIFTYDETPINEYRAMYANNQNAKIWDEEEVFKSSYQWPWDGYGISNTVTEVEIMPSMKDCDKFTRMDGMFRGFSNAHSIIGAEYLDTSHVSSMSSMFQYFGSNTNNVVFAPDVSKWDTSSLTNVNQMFAYIAGAGCNEFKVDVSNWNWDNIKNMDNVFASNGTDQSKWKVIIPEKTGNKDNTPTCLYGAVYYNQDRQKTNPPNGCEFSFPEYSLVATYNTANKELRLAYTKEATADCIPAGQEANYKVWSEAEILKGASESAILGTNPSTTESKWPWNNFSEEIEKVVIEPELANFDGFTTLAYMFKEFSNVQSITGEEYLNTSNVTNMAYMFYRFGADSETFDHVMKVDNWDVTKVEDMSHMFQQYGVESNIVGAPDVSNWTTTSLKNVLYMFEAYGANAKNDDYEFKLNLKYWDTSSIVQTESMLLNTGINKPATVIIPKQGYGSGNDNGEDKFMCSGDAKITPGETYASFTVEDVNYQLKAVYDYVDKDNAKLTIKYDARTYSPLKAKTIIISDGAELWPWDGRDWNNIRAVVTDVVVDGSMKHYKVQSGKYMFANFTKAKSIRGTEYLDVSEATDLSYMFLQFGLNSGITYAPDISTWNVENVTNLSSMFVNYGGMEPKNLDFRLDLTKRNPKSIGDYGCYMFVSFNGQVGQILIPRKSPGHSEENDEQYWHATMNGYYIPSPQGIPFTLVY